MKLRTAIVLVAAFVSGAGCGPKSIKKLPVPREDEIRAIQLAAEADQMMSENKDHLALSKLLDASYLNPYSESIFNKLAVCYSRLGMFDQGEKAINRAIGLNSKYPFAYNTLGIVLLGKQKEKRATGAFRKAIKLQPRIANFYLNLGYAEIQRGHMKEARVAYSKALEMDPSALNATMVVELGLVNTPENAEKYYKTAVVFAEIGSLPYCLKYLSDALASGFSDFERLESEKAFQGFREDPDFQELLQRYGIDSHP